MEALKEAPTLYHLGVYVSTMLVSGSNMVCWCKYVKGTSSKKGAAFEVMF